jgi:phosphatidylserine/phosphatidylglycerophosphate/cardiolipin synthase-like enzyme
MEDEPKARAPQRLLTVSGGPRLANGGDELALVDREGRLVDRLVYGDGGSSAGWDAAGWANAGWIGSSLKAYAGGVLGAGNQVLSRKLDPETGRPVPDTNAAVDWAADPADPILGRRPRYPGWDLEERWRPPRVQGLARVEVALAPDSLRDFLLRHFGAAQQSLDLMVYSFENPALAEVLAERARAGVRLRLLLEGRPVGGIDLAQRWCLARITEAGGEVWWMDRGGEIGPRYRGAHAKLALIDGRRVLIGSENPNLGATPGDDLSDGTAGRRGVYAMIEHPGVAEWARQLFADDLAPEQHVDLRPFQARDPERGAPPDDYRPEWAGGGSGYAPIRPQTLHVQDGMRFDLITSPENSLDPLRGIPGLVARAGPGDRVLVQQLDEPYWWGDGPAEGPVALNARVQAYIAAARRGATVRLLLDGYFDDPDHWNSNRATADALARIAVSEGLDLKARLGNPAGKGLHNKMLLVTEGCGAADAPPHSVRSDPNEDACLAHWSHLGSINGSEVASKANREAGVSIDSKAVHAWLADIFALDWAVSDAATAYLPMLSR